MNTIKGNFIALKYKTNIEVEGVGEYQIEITNIINTKTFEKRHIVPSLMNMANFQRIEANRCKKELKSQIAIQQSTVPFPSQETPFIKSIKPNRTQEGLRKLLNLFKKRVQRNFDYLQMGSIDYKRTLLIKQ